MIRRAQPWLGTLVEVCLPDDATDARSAAGAIDAAFAAVAMVHRRMSFHDADSDVSAINRLAVGGHCRVDAHTATVLRCALQLEAASGGGFNIACADLLAAWGQLPAVGPAESPFTGAPTETAIASGIGPIGAGAGLPVPADAHAPTPGLPRNVLTVDADEDGMATVRRQRPGKIDLGGIAKGYAVDLAIGVLQAAGAASASVNAGGDLRACGPAGMRVGIRDPANPRRIAREVFLRDHALATSAGYFSRRHGDGLDHCALVDGATARPILHGRSVTVMAPTCMLADGLTKPVFASADAMHPLLARFGATALLL